MPKRIFLLLAVAALVLPGAAQAESLTIQVTSIVVKFDSIDKRPKGASKGDKIVYRDRLLNTVRQFGKARGTHVGSDRGTMTFTSANTARFDGSATLPGGTVRIKGPVTPVADGGFRIPVAGGTGRYAAAKGTLTVGPGDKRALNVYRLTLPGNVA